MQQKEISAGLTNCRLLIYVPNKKRKVIFTVSTGEIDWIYPPVKSVRAHEAEWTN